MVPRFLYPLLPYRSLLAPVLILTAIVIPCWLIFRLYRGWRGELRSSLKREMKLLALVAYCSGLVAVTLTPNSSSGVRAEGAGGIELRPNVASLTCSSPTVPRDSSARSFCVRNARGNVVLFLPLGILIPLVWPQLTFWAGIQIALVLSSSIEVIQYLSSAWGSYRAADINDVILNVAGAGLGLTLMFLLRYAVASLSPPPAGKPRSVP
jgi:glycopeptide antibiotics resistance protein